MPGGDSRLSNPAPGMSLDALRNRSMTHHDHGRIERPEGSQVHRDEAPGSEGTAAGMTGGPVPLAGSRPSDPLDKVGLRIPPQPIRPNADPCPLPSGQKCAQSWRGVQGIVLSSESSVSSAMAVSPGVPAPVFLAPKGHRQKPSPRRRGSRGFRVKEKAGSPSILGRDGPDGRQGLPCPQERMRSCLGEAIVRGRCPDQWLRVGIVPIDIAVGWADTGCPAWPAPGQCHPGIRHPFHREIQAT